MCPNRCIDACIPDRWILTPDSNSGEIQRAFAVLSQAAIRTSQGAQVVQFSGFSN
jgi:hypothetical protein